MERCCTVVKGSLVRLLFSASAGMCVWLTSAFDSRYWLLWLAVSVFMFMEGTYTLAVKKHGSWNKWFSPTIALFLLCTVPCLWLIELDIFRTRRRCVLLSDCDAPTFNSTGLPPIFGIQIPSYKLTLPDWSLILHQTFLFSLILGRWFLPKGELSRDQLSQLLLVQIGMAADILEFITEGLKVSEIYKGNVHMMTLLIVWTISLPQFTLSLTLTSAKKRRVAGVNPLPVVSPQTPGKEREDDFGCCHFFCGTEVWAILVTMVMQDLPFLGARLSLIMSQNIAFSTPLFFFTFKNALLSLLELYRLAVILREFRRKRRARVKVGVVATSDAVELGDVASASADPRRGAPDSGPAGHPAESRREDPATAVWFTSRFLNGCGGDSGQDLRLRKHVSVQTDFRQRRPVVTVVDHHAATFRETRAAVEEAGPVDNEDGSVGWWLAGGDRGAVEGTHSENEGEEIHQAICEIIANV